MQSLATFFEDNKPLAYAAVAAAIVVLIFVVFVLYRLLFGRRLRAATNGRARQPRLGIVDAYDLDRQRQLVLVRRDNVEHLIMIGGPTDVVVESSIVRTQTAAVPRDKDAAGPLVGSVTPATAIPPSPAPAALAAAAQPAMPPAGVGRSDPAIGTRNEPTLGPRGDAPATVRTEPSLGMATPMPSPVVDRAPPERGTARPIAVPDPSAPPGPPPRGEAGPPQSRNAPPRPASLPPRPAAASALPGSTLPAPTPSPVTGQGAEPSVEQPVGSSRPPLPPRPPVQRPPLPPRPSLASSLPPRPPRPPLPGRAEPSRAEPPRPEPGAATDQVSPGPPGETDPRVVRGPDAAPPRNGGPPSVPPKTIESLESLEEEMAKLLGRPAPRRDG